MTEPKKPSQSLHDEIATLIATGARPASDVEWDEVAKFIAPVARYFDALIDLGDEYPSGGSLVREPGDQNDRLRLLLLDEGDEVWLSKPIALDIPESEQ